MFGFSKKKKGEVDTLPPGLPQTANMPNYPAFDNRPIDNLNMGPLDTGMPPIGGAGPQLPSAPMAPAGGLSHQTEEPIKLLTEDLEEISEAIIAEKWAIMKKELDKTNDAIKASNEVMTHLQDKMIAMEKKMTMLESSILGKVDDYSHGISDVRVEMKAMQKVFQTMMPAFTENIKDLQSLVEKTKAKKR